MVKLCDDCACILRDSSGYHVYVMEHMCNNLVAIYSAEFIPYATDFEELEQLGYLLSTETGKNEITYILNTDKALYSPSRDELCWCRYAEH